MTLNLINLNNINFKENTEIKSEENKVLNSIKSDYERTLPKDSFVKNEDTGINSDENSIQEIEQAEQKEISVPKRKKHLAKNIIFWAVTIPILLYGGLVLKHKLSKPTLEEVQKYFKEIFDKDLSKEEVNDLLDKYKNLLKNNNTEDFAKQMIEQLKKDYGIEKVSTNVSVERLKDGKIKTIMEHTKLGDTSPLGDINILPRTSSDVLGKRIQKEIFTTGFHELKHMKQFADAYCADPDKFVDAIYEQNVTKDMVENCIKEIKKNLKQEAENLYKSHKYQGLSLKEIEKALEKGALKEVKGDYEKYFIKETKKKYRQMLDERFGSLKRYKKGTEEYKKGMEYIEAYAKYSDYNKDYDAYRKNLLEKEAWQIGDLANKIYKYITPIWKI